MNLVAADTNKVIFNQKNFSSNNFTNVKQTKSSISPLGNKVNRYAFSDQESETLDKSGNKDRQNRWNRRGTIRYVGNRQSNTAGSWHNISYRWTCACGMIPKGEWVEQKVVKNDDGAYAYYKGLFRCSSIWACPVCSHAIRIRRQLEVQAAALAHTNNGGSLLMLTLTLKHQPNHGLEELLEVLNSCWTKTLNNKSWAQNVKPHLVGTIKAVEITQGKLEKGGSWHPHLHILLFVKKGKEEEVKNHVEKWLPKSWKKAVAKKLDVSPDLLHGVDIRSIDASASAYITKISQEITRSDTKGKDRNIWALVDGMKNGEAAAFPAWKEYTSATKGKRALIWSNGLKKLLIPEVEDKTDEEIIEEEKGGEVVKTIHRDEWNEKYCKTNKDGKIVALAEIEKTEDQYNDQWRNKKEILTI